MGKEKYIVNVFTDQAVLTSHPSSQNSLLKGRKEVSRQWLDASTSAQSQGMVEVTARSVSTAGDMCQ
jgi:hypothetical protein